MNKIPPFEFIPKKQTSIKLQLLIDKIYVFYPYQINPEDCYDFIKKNKQKIESFYLHHEHSTFEKIWTIKTDPSLTNYTFDCNSLTAYGPAIANKIQLNKVKAQLIYYVYEQCFYKTKLPFSPPLIIKKLHKAWGICREYNQKKTIFLDPACADLPPELLEYVIFHELTHIIHMNHSTSFWKQLSDWLPNAKKLDIKINKFIK